MCLCGLRTCVPVFLCVDVQGPNGGVAKFDGEAFVSSCMKFSGMLSLGWTTGPGDGGYTNAHVHAMHQLVDRHHLDDVTFPVRADLCANSWHELERLLSGKRTLTLWGKADAALRQWIATLPPHL